MKERGLCIIYTGEGKGKTTAALGLALRFVGHGKRVCLIQFVKDPGRGTGERAAARRLAPELEFHTLGRGFVFGKKPDEKHRRAARGAWDFALEKINAGLHDLVVLDEIACLFGLGFLDPVPVQTALEERPPHVHVLLTGRGMPDVLVWRADLVTDMTEVRHPFHSGRRNIIGIDY